ncbi:DUF3823 domain-containing protein [Echinicola shivajiensis]|uniref:DUF3823 domain-containing protein n=1 Tax=Echinicola shivajiensis TaxID=1035916 RepID=UPI001BFCA271|nr:DUF3823 domain-containing protein [Echinicola shivajiensis]
MKKRSLYMLFLIIWGCYSCELDNYEGPTAGISGRFIDAETGELVEQDIVRGTVIQLTEHGYDPVAHQYLVVKNDGSYENSMLFENTYTVQPVRGNFVPVEPMDIYISAGTVQDFEVLPYLRIKNLDIRVTDRKIIATFNVEQNVINNVSKVGLYLHTEPTVGEPIHSLSAELTLGRAVEESESITLEIDLEANSSLVDPDDRHFVRVGGLVDAAEAKFNYASAQEVEL